VTPQVLIGALVAVGSGPPDACARRVLVLVGDGRRSDEARDFRRDGRGGVPGLLLPALDAEAGSVADEEVGRRLHVRPQGVVPGEARLQGHQDRVGRLIQLVVEGIGRLRAVEQGIARLRSVWLLAGEQQVAHGIACRLNIAVRVQGRPGLVEVAGEHLLVTADEQIVRIVGDDGLAPRGV